MDTILGIIAFVVVIAFFTALFLGMNFLYVKIIKKMDMPKKRKKIWITSIVVFVVSVVSFDVATKIEMKIDSELSMDEEKYENHDSNYTLHQITNLKTSYDAEHEGDQVIIGETNAPDGSVVLISSEYLKESNSASNASGELVKVTDGKFKAYISSIYLSDGEKMKKGQKAKINAIAAEKYDRSASNAIFYMLGENQLSSLKPTSISLSDEVVTYYNALSEDDDSKSEESQSSSSKTESKPKENILNSSKEESYLTDIAYEQLARTPDDYFGKNVSMTGKVIQVMENSQRTQLRVSINGNVDEVVLVEIKKTNLGKSRILDNDLITFYGTSQNVITYEATSGQKITVPAILANKIENQGKAPDDYGLNY